MHYLWIWWASLDYADKGNSPEQQYAKGEAGTSKDVMGQAPGTSVDICKMKKNKVLLCFGLCILFWPSAVSMS